MTRTMALTVHWQPYTNLKSRCALQGFPSGGSLSPPIFGTLVVCRDWFASKRRTHKMASTPSCERFIGIGTTVLALILFADDLAAQGLPVETASHVPVGVWFIGAAILGLAIA